VLDILESLHEEGLTLVMVTHDPAIGERANVHLRMIDGLLQIEDAQL